ncbi:hypothetical protein [Streptomyces sp. 900105245]
MSLPDRQELIEILNKVNTVLSNVMSAHTEDVARRGIAELRQLSADFEVSYTSGQVAWRVMLPHWFDLQGTLKELNLSSNADVVDLDDAIYDLLPQPTDTGV